MTLPAAAARAPAGSYPSIAGIRGASRATPAAVDLQGGPKTGPQTHDRNSVKS